MMLLRALSPLSSGFVASNGAVARRAGPLSQLRFRLVHPTPSQPHPALRWNVAAAGSGGASASLDVSEMVSVLVNVEVKPERLDEFLDVMRKDAEGSRTEPGCLRFDVLQDQENPCKFVFYEGYKNAEAAAEHRDYPHFKLWTDFKVCATGEQASATCLLLPPGHPLHSRPTASSTSLPAVLLAGRRRGVLRIVQAQVHAVGIFGCLKIWPRAAARLGVSCARVCGLPTSLQLDR